MILFKEIKIHPSEWHLDIIVSKNKKEINEFFKKRYGIDDYYDAPNECASVDSGKDSLLKHEKRFAILLETLSNKGVIVHELIHALWHLTKRIGLEMNYDTQEWQAVLYEYLYVETVDKKGYAKM